MPLLPGDSPDVISKNVAELIRAGHERTQAVAIAYANARRSRRDRGKLPVPVKALPKRLTRQVLPNRIESEYAKALTRVVVKPLRVAYAPVHEAVRKLVADTASRADAYIAGRTTVPPARFDADDVKKVRALLDAAAKKVGGMINVAQLQQLARQFANRTQEYQKTQLKRQIKNALGADPTFGDKNLAERIGHFVKENVSLVKRIPERLHGELAGLVEQGAQQAWATPYLAETIADRFGIAERHANLIARDQIGGLYADVNHARQRSLGVTRFIWRTVEDEAVRGDPDGKYPKALPSHFALDGQTFDYDDPPMPEGADGPIMPGDEIQCRCYAEPVLDDVLGDDEDDDEEYDDERGDSASWYASRRAAARVRKDYAPDQERDKDGKFTSGGTSASDLEKAEADRETSINAELEYMRKTQLTKLSGEEKSAVYDWTGPVYDSINRIARQGDDGSEDPEDVKAVDRIDSALDKVKTEKDMTVYRGFNGTRLGPNLKAGSVITDHGFISTTASKAVASNFASMSGGAHLNAGALVEISLPKGAHALAVTGSHGSEQEVLLPRNAQFRIDSISSPVKDKPILVKATLLPEKAYVWTFKEPKNKLVIDSVDKVRNRYTWTDDQIEITTRADFDESEARGSDGKWTGSGGGATKSPEQADAHVRSMYTHGGFLKPKVEGAGKKIGILPGTYDPPHEDHINLAKAVAKEFGLDEVVLVGNPDPDHKPGATPYETRAEMLAARVAKEPGLNAFSLPQHESPSGNAALIAKMQESYPGAHLYQVMGDDVYDKLRSKDKLKANGPAQFIVLRREAVPPKLDVPDHLKAVVNESKYNPGRTLSSSQIRAEFKAGAPVPTDQVDPAVQDIVKAHGLYKSA